MKKLQELIDKHKTKVHGEYVVVESSVVKIAIEYAEQAIDECAGIAEADFNILDKEAVISEVEVYVLKESILQVKQMLK